MAVTLAGRLRTQSGECARLGSPLYAELLARAAEDVEAGGVVADTFAGREQLPGRLVPGLRLMGALHRLVLQGRAAELAAFYPSAGGDGRPADAWPAMRRVLARHRREVGALLDRPVQTNEVGRAAALFGGLLVAAAWFPGRPVAVRLLELGTSAGLNLRADRFADQVGGATLGSAGSPVRLAGEPWVGTPLPDPGGVRIRVVERAGCDPHPVDPATGEGRLTLASFVWADQVERMARLRAALRVAARVPARVERAGAAVAAAAERARGGRGPALARLALESRRVTDRYLFELRLEGSFLPAGRLPVLALAEGHGPPVHWWPEGPAAPIPPPR